MVAGTTIARDERVPRQLLLPVGRRRWRPAPLKLAHYLPAMGDETRVLAPDDPRWLTATTGCGSRRRRGCTALRTRRQRRQATRCPPARGRRAGAHPGAPAAAATRRPGREGDLGRDGDPGRDQARASRGSTSSSQPRRRRDAPHRRGARSTGFRWVAQSLPRRTISRSVGFAGPPTPRPLLI